VNLVKSTDYGIKGVNYYWTRRERYNLTEAELIAAGLTDGDAYIDESLVEPLRRANTEFKRLGYEIIIKDGYRSPDVYKLVQAKRYALQGREVVDSFLNVERAVHATGRAVDISLLDLKTGEELYFRDGKDDPGAYFIDYYKNHTDAAGREFQRRQDMLISTMLGSGLVLGTKNEYWHFELIA
jgi:D-alanyl-D-alanine dipeptidase